MHLMHKHSQVATVDLCISPYLINIKTDKIIQQEHLPYLVRQKKVTLQDWLLSRCLPMDTHRNIFLVQFAIKDFTRSIFMPFLLTLFTNSINLTDKYWLNPIESIMFMCNGINIVFNKTSWKAIEPFRNQILSEDLNECAFNDCFFYVGKDDFKIPSLNWTTNGDAIKRWLIIDDKYVLEKRLNKKQCQKELETLEFFFQHGIKVPNYTYEHVIVEDDTTRYNFDVIKEGYYSIKKECLTDRNTILEDLASYVSNDKELEIPIKRMFKLYNVSNEKTELFINTSKEYKKKFNVERDGHLDTRNFGLLINNDGDVEPIVWSGLQLEIV